MRSIVFISDGFGELPWYRNTTMLPAIMCILSSGEMIDVSPGVDSQVSTECAEIINFTYDEART
jgi:hypothetical protein